MQFMLPALVPAFVVCLLYVLIAGLISRRTFELFARKHGCELPFNDDQTNTWIPWNLQRLRKILTARRNGTDPLDEYMVPPLFLHHTLMRTALFGERTIETIDPENVRMILTAKFNDWEIGTRRSRAFEFVLGHSIFTSDGDFWMHSRRLLRPQFAREKIDHGITIERSIYGFFKALGPANPQGWTEIQDITPLVYRFVLDNATDFLFGTSVGSQEAAMKESDGPEEHPESSGAAEIAGGNTFAEAFDECSYWMTFKFRLQSLGFLWNTRAMKEAARTVRSVSEHYVQQALAKDWSKRHNDGRFDLLSTLVDYTKNETELRDQALSVMFASRDTTSDLINWTLLLLSQHPRILQRLREEVSDQFQDDSGETLGFAQLKNCRFLSQVLYETLRLYAVVPLNSRVAVRDTVLPKGGGVAGDKPIAIRKGEQVLWNVYAMHRRMDLWGDDAWHFKPERWDNPRKSRLLGGGWLFLPFSGGPRVCMGQQYALNEASYFLVRLLQRYDAIEADADSELGQGRPPAKKMGISLGPVHLRVRLHLA